MKNDAFSAPFLPVDVVAPVDDTLDGTLPPVDTVAAATVDAAALLALAGAAPVVVVTFLSFRPIR